jgi:hypothetical protein
MRARETVSPHSIDEFQSDECQRERPTINDNIVCVEDENEVVNVDHLLEPFPGLRPSEWGVMWSDYELHASYW